MTNTTKTTIILHTTEGVPTLKDLQNAVRRLSGIEVPAEGSVESKGVTITVQPVKRVPAKSKQDIRNWLGENGHPEVLGKRGRISKELTAKFQAAHA